MVILQKERSENSRSYAVRVLLYNIIHLELQPGAAVSENELSATLSFSRTQVSEALIELNRIGLVEILPQRGSYISKIDYNIVEESRFLRLVTENAILKLLCDKIADADMDALDYNIKKQQRSLEQKDRETFLELDNEFHELLFRAADKMWSYHIIKEQMVHFDRLRSLSTKSKQHDYVLKDHEDILYAIKRHDAEMAEMLMTRHLTRHLSEKKELLTMYPDYFTNNLDCRSYNRQLLKRLSRNWQSFSLVNFPFLGKLCFYFLLISRKYHIIGNIE